MVKNLLSNAWEVDLIPGQGTKISHAEEQLSSYTSTIEACNPQRKILHAATQLQRSQINTFKKINKVEGTNLKISF